MALHHQPYPGESEQKKIARAITYARLKHIWSITGQPEGKFIVLAGDGIELNLLRYFMKCDPRDVIFIDNKVTTGLWRVRNEWSKAHTIKGDVLKLLRKLDEPIAFANLDFMGHFRIGKTDKILQEISTRLEDRGAVAFTFTRGRESDKHTKHWGLLKRHALAFSREASIPFSEDKSLVRDEIRFMGYRHLISSLLGKERTVTISELKYTRRAEGGSASGYSLGVQLFQMMPPTLRTTKWFEATLLTPIFKEEKLGRIESVGVKDRLRELVYWGLKQGWTSKELGGLFDLSTKTIAAYRANATRAKKR